MSRVQVNRVAAVGRTIFLCGVAWVLIGCGGKDKPEPSPQPASQTMVPATSDTAWSDTTGALAPATSTTEHPAGTSVTAGVHSAQSDREAGNRPPQKSSAKPAGDPITSARASAGTGAYSLQLGSFRSEANALAAVERIAALGQTPEVEVATLGGQTYHRVVLRGLADRAEAERLGEIIRSQLGITYLIRQK